VAGLVQQLDWDWDFWVVVWGLELEVSSLGMHILFRARNEGTKGLEANGKDDGWYRHLHLSYESLDRTGRRG
jgi:hypothetical protein